MLVASILALLAAEVWLRITGKATRPDAAGPRYLFVRDAELGVRLRPGFAGVHRHAEFRVGIEIDGQGFRDDELGPKKPDELRILFLSDSFGYGYGVEAEETCAEVLERSLAARLAPRPIEVVNAGGPSYGQREMATLLARVAATVEPDLVLATFFFGNDLADNLSSGFTERGGLLLTPYAASIVDGSPRLSFALEHSDLWVLLERLWLDRKRPRSTPVDPESLDVQAPGIRWIAEHPDDEAERQWQALEQELGRIQRTSSERGAHAALVLVPMPYQFDASRWEALRARHALSDGDYDLELVSRRLAEACASVGIPVLDLAQAWRGRTDGESLYFSVNRHWNAAGHQAAAAAVEAFLVERGWLEN